MYSQNSKFRTAIIFNFLFFLLSIQGRRNKGKSEDKVISFEAGGNLYKIYFMKKNWLETVLECEDRDSNIAEVNSIQAKTLARLMLMNRPAIESVWIGDFKESMNGFFREGIKNLSDNRDKLQCLFLDCHLDGIAVMKSSCNRRRYVVCQNKSISMHLQKSSTLIKDISPPLKINISKFISENVNNNQTFTTSLQSAPLLLSTTTPYLISIKKSSTLDSTEARIQSKSVLKIKELPINNYKQSSKVVNHIKYSNKPKLYYAFEGPLVGKLDDMNNNSNNNNNSYYSYSMDKKKLTHKYQKYISSQSLKLRKTVFKK